MKRKAAIGAAVVGAVLLIVASVVVSENDGPRWAKIVLACIWAGVAFAGPVGILIGGLFEFVCRGRGERLIVGCVVGAILLTVALSALHFTTYDIEGSTTVYTTRTGSCYHKPGCDTLKSKYKTTIREAESGGYRACEVCDPVFWAYATPVLWRALLSAAVAWGAFVAADAHLAKKKSDPTGGG